MVHGAGGWGDGVSVSDRRNSMFQAWEHQSVATPRTWILHCGQRVEEVRGPHVEGSIAGGQSWGSGEPGEATGHTRVRGPPWLIEAPAGIVPRILDQPLGASGADRTWLCLCVHITAWSSSAGVLLLPRTRTRTEMSNFCASPWSAGQGSLRARAGAHSAAGPLAPGVPAPSLSAWANALGFLPRSLCGPCWGCSAPVQLKRRPRGPRLAGHSQEGIC